MNKLLNKPTINALNAVILALWQNGQKRLTAIEIDGHRITVSEELPNEQYK